MRAVDLFAGAGGWDVAARQLGIKTYGIENNADAVKTQVHAGHNVIHADVRHGDRVLWPTAKDATGLIASPPCQTFSAAGKGSGRANLDAVLSELDYLAWGEPLDYSKFDDERTGLVLEPMRWILDAHGRDQPYEWVALEQVPAVLPVWEAYAEILLNLGYSTDVRKLHAEQYGVPQTRTRAILVAHLGKDVSLPTPTYSRYHPRTPDKVDPGTERWISMAEWLGWHGGDRVGFPQLDDGLATVDIDGTAYRARDFREADLPAFNLTEKARSWTRLRSNTSENATVRNIDEPAPTLHFGDRLNKATWESMGDRRASRGTVRDVDEPAPTVTSSLDNGNYRWSDEPAPGPGRWVHERPATTVQSTDRIGRPGHKCMTLDCHPGRGTNAQFDGSIRVSLEEAAALQTFPVNYPWQGTKTSIFRQIGNAIPPVLAHAILAELIKE